MIFKSFYHKDALMAFYATIGSYHIFYGTKNLKRSDLRSLFPSWKFCFVQQVHGKCLVEASDHTLLKKADAHFTHQDDYALVVQTADCLPIFAWNLSTLSAIHAGWRGVNQNIVSEVIQYFLSVSQSPIQWSIGPHISKDHFLVHQDVAMQLAQCANNAKQWIDPINEKRYKICLSELVKSQIFSQIGVSKIHTFDKDTFSSKIFYSYRRTAEKNIGQYSFIVRSNCFPIS